MAKQDDEGRLAEKRLLSPEDHQILRDLLDVQRQRIVMESRRADVATKALEIADVQDQRRFEFASKTHDDSVALEKEKLKRVSAVVWALLGLAGVVVLAMLGFFFLGNETQRAAAASLVTPVLIAVAGYGVIKTLVTAVKGLIGR